jgi:hypothetical protein
MRQQKRQCVDANQPSRPAGSQRRSDASICVKKRAPPTIWPMQFLQSLRNAKHLVRWMLVWFALSLGVAVASPLVNPQATELICSGTGVMKLLVKNADGSSSEVTSRMPDCPLCATVSAPPPVATPVAMPAQPLGHVLQAVPAAHIAALTAAPPPGRGPPLFF